MRAFFLFVGLFLWMGILLSGMDQVHWTLYLPATFFLFSAITGICPGLIFFTDFFSQFSQKKASDKERRQ